MKQHFGNRLVKYSLLLLLLTGSLPADAQRNRGKAKQPAKKQQTKAAAKKKEPAKKQTNTTRRATPTPQQPALQSRNAAGGGDTVLQTTRLEITQVYKPEIKRAPRPDFNPAPPAADTIRTAQTYDVPQQTLNYTYRSLPLRPLALGADTSVPPLQSYLKLGGGNISTIFAEAGIAALRGENFSSAIHARRLSQAGEIKGQQSSRTELNADGTLRTGGHIWDANLGGSYSRFRYYGYDHSVFDYNVDTLKQAFTEFHAGLAVQNDQELAGGWHYRPEVKAGVYSDKYDAAERYVAFAVPVTKDFDSMMQLRLEVNGVLGQYTVGDTISRGNNLIQLAPSVRYRQDGFEGILGVTPSFGHKNWLLPQISAAYRFTEAPIELNAGWNARIQRNTYQELSTRNPFMSNIYRQEQSRADEAHLGGQATFARNFSVNARVSYWQWTDLPLFLNNYAEIPDGKKFDVVYDGLVNAISFQAGMRYQVGETFAVGASGAWYNFYKSSFSRLWQEPGVRLKADIMVRPVKNLRVTGNVTVLDQMYAQNNLGQEVKLPAYADIGLGAEYQLIPRLSLFLQTSNLLNRRNERWNGYASYNFNIYGGVSFRF